MSDPCMQYFQACFRKGLFCLGPDPRSPADSRGRTVAMEYERRKKELKEEETSQQFLFEADQETELWWMGLELEGQEDGVPILLGRRKKLRRGGLHRPLTARWVKTEKHAEKH